VVRQVLGMSWRLYPFGGVLSTGPAVHPPTSPRRLPRPAPLCGWGLKQLRWEFSIAIRTLETAPPRHPTRILRIEVRLIVSVMRVNLLRCAGSSTCKFLPASGSARRKTPNEFPPGYTGEKPT